MITTTLKDLRKQRACVSGYNKVVSALKGVPFDPERETYIRFNHTARIDLLSILETNGLDDTLWALRASDASDRDCRLFAVCRARHVEPLNDDPRIKECNDVSERFANGDATEGELDAARDAAWDAERDAAWGAAWAAARDAAWDAVWDAAWGAAWGAAWDAQKEMFVKMCKGEAPWQI